MNDFTTLSIEELSSATGGQQLLDVKSVPGAWRPNSGMGTPPTPGGSPMGNWSRSAASGEAAFANGGGGGGGKNPMQMRQREQEMLAY